MAGCGGSGPTPVAGGGSGGGGGTAITGPAIAGVVLGGTAPLPGLRVQLYAAGTTGNGSPGTALGTPATTDAKGAFTIPAGSYTCASAASVLYLVATGGGGATALLSSPGICGSAAASVTLNERTTVADAWALRPFLSDGGRLGSTATNVGGLTLAVARAASLVDPVTGAAPGATFPANGIAPSVRIDTLANALHACVAANAPCVPLFLATAVNGISAADTLDAALHAVSQPGTSVGALFGLAQTQPVFFPALAAAPADWTLPVVLSGGGLTEPTALSFDADGQLWVANNAGGASLFTNVGAPIFPDGISGYGLDDCYGGAVDASGRFWVTNQQSAQSVNNGAGSVTILTVGGGIVISSRQITAGGIDYPSSIAFDRNGNAWVTDLGNAHLTLLGSDGASKAGTAGLTGPSLSFPDAVAVDGSGNAWVGNMSLPTVAEWGAGGTALGSFAVGSYQSAVAVDASNNIWTANYTGNTAGLISSAGRVVSGAGFTGGGLRGPAGLALDGAGTAWISNYGAPGVTALASAGSAQPGLAISPAAGWAPDAGTQQGFAVAIDAAGSVWITSFATGTLTILVGAAAPVRTPLLGPVQVP